MRMLQAKVKHDTLGIGIVTEFDGRYITIQFDEKTSRFVYPDVFQKHLKALDQELQESVLREITWRKMAEKEQHKQTEDERKAAEERVRSEKLESLLNELNNLIGLEQVKNDVKSLMNFMQICRLREQRGMAVPTISYHLVFTGNPGTGKTTVARIVAELYHLMGILPKGQLVETDRSGLVAGYLGQTAIKTQKVIQDALGGVLFIDEAYSLVNDKGDSFGKESIETILKAMEDHREELVVIVAGYEELMHQFIDSNPGLRSRFNKFFHFPDYTVDELLLIFLKFCEDNEYILPADIFISLQKKLHTIQESGDEHFGNARTVRNLFESAISRQADRLARLPVISDDDLQELTAEDIIS